MKAARGTIPPCHSAASTVPYTLMCTEMWVDPPTETPGSPLHTFWTSLYALGLGSASPTGSEVAAVGALSAGGYLGVFPAPPFPSPCRTRERSLSGTEGVSGVAWRLGPSQETMVLSTPECFSPLLRLLGL